MKALVNLLRQTEFHALIFFLFLVLAGWPFLASAGEGGVVGLFVYLLLIWGILILVLFFISRGLARCENSETAVDDDRGGGSNV